MTKIQQTLFASLIIFSTSVFAVNDTAVVVTSSVPVSNYTGVDARDMTQTTSTNYAPPADLSKSVGNSYAPALTTTMSETCMGSTSAGAGGAGFSFSFGTTWRDTACVRRLDAREIASYGDRQMAKEIMCDSDLVREAAKRVGRPCAVDGGTYKTETPAVQTQSQQKTLSTEEYAVLQEIVKKKREEQEKATIIFKK